MEMKIRESNGAFKVTVTSLAGQELAVYREGLGSFTFELREAEEEEFEMWNAEEIHASEDAEEFQLERVPIFKANERNAIAAQKEFMQEDAAAIVNEVKEVAKNNALFHRLSGLRRELASAANVPPYMIFPDKTLWGMVEKMPLDLFSLGNINGVGKVKLEKYGATFLSALKESA